MYNLDAIISIGYRINSNAVLKGKGTISRKNVDKFVKMEYEKFKPVQDRVFKSDYDLFVEETKRLM